MKFISFARVIAGFALAASISQAQVREKRITPVDPATRRNFEQQTKVAVLIGVGRYPARSGLSLLRYPSRDVQELDGELRRQGYKVVALTDQDATSGSVVQALKDAAELVDRGSGTVLFFFSGHGFTDRGTNYLATFEATSADLAATGLAVRRVEDLLKATGAPRQVIFVDACRDEPGKGLSARTFERLQASAGLRELFSTKMGRISYEDDELQNGVFAHFLIEGMRGAAAGGDGLITFHDLAEYVTEAVSSYGFRKGRMQVPFEAGESSGDFLLGRATTAPDTSEAAPTTLRTPVGPPASAAAPAPSMPTGPRQIGSLDISPDGRMAAFDDGKAIYTLSLQTGQVRKITEDGKSFAPRWVGSGRLVFLSLRSGARQAWMMDADGSAARPLMASPREAREIRVARDGSAAFVTEPDPARCDPSKASASMAVCPLGFLRSIDLRTPLPAPFQTINSSMDLNAPWAVAPDGAEVAWTLFGQSPEMRVSDRPGAERTIASGKRYNLPAYSPDGNSLAYFSQPLDEHEKWSLSVLQRATGRVNTILDLTARELSSPVWSPDSQRVFVAWRDQQGASRIVFAPAQGGSSRTVFSGEAPIERFQFTPDGKAMICVQRSDAGDGLIRLDSSGVPPTMLVRLGQLP